MRSGPECWLWPTWAILAWCLHGVILFTFRERHYAFLCLRCASQLRARNPHIMCMCRALTPGREKKPMCCRMRNLRFRLYGAGARSAFRIWFFCHLYLFMVRQGLLNPITVAHASRVRMFNNIRSLYAPHDVDLIPRGQILITGPRLKIIYWTIPRNA
jgi:hypothetical protein